MPTPVSPQPRFSWTKGSTLFEKFRLYMGNWTQEGMAAYVGVPLGTWRNWEQGKAQPNMKRTEILNRLATEQGLVSQSAMGPGEAEEGLISPPPHERRRAVKIGNALLQGKVCHSCPISPPEASGARDGSH